MSGKRLTEGSIKSHMYNITVPMTWGIVAVMSKNLVDTYFVAQLGTESLSGLSFAFPIILTVMSLGIGLSAGAASVVSRSLGDEQQKQAQDYTTSAMILSSILMVTLAILGFFLSPWLFNLMGAHGTTHDQILAYMNVWWIALPPLALLLMANALIRSTGESFRPSLVMMASALINALLDPFLIFGWWGLPKLGIAGAAYATLVSNVFAACLLFWMLFGEVDLLVAKIPSLSDLLASWRDVVVIAVPAAASNAINPLGLSILTSLLATFGQESVAGFGVAARIESFGVVGMLALSGSIGPIVGQNFGARKLPRVREAMSVSYISCAAYGFVLAVLLALLSPWLIPLFDQHPKVIAVAQQYLWIVPISLMGYGFNIVAAGALNAVGRPLIATALTFVRMMIFYLPLAYALSAVMGLMGIFVATFVANAMAGLTSILTTRWVFHPKTIEETS